MRRLIPPVVLVVMAFLVAELLPGSAPINQPLFWPFLIMIYGPRALLIRELVRRGNRGWESILLLGATYRLIEEGLPLESLFNPTLYSAAASGPNRGLSISPTRKLSGSRRISSKAKLLGQADAGRFRTIPTSFLPIPAHPSP